jgi:Tfp pilus assembly protein FimT
MAGMTYIELIVVLGIFSTMLGVALFNHNKFQDKVSIKNLANEIALRLVEAQKSAIGGKWNAGATYDWKPSYGVHFNLSSPGNNQSFIFFADLNADEEYDVTDTSFCPNPGLPNDECLDKISLTRGNVISNLDFFYADGTSTPLSNLTAAFTRPDSGATVRSTTPPTGTLAYAQITVVSPGGFTARVKVYPSGRIQIN